MQSFPCNGHSLFYLIAGSNDDGVLQFQTNSTNVTLVLGTAALLPFTAGYNSNGSAESSTDTYNGLTVSYPVSFTQIASLFEITPYNYGIYIPVVDTGTAGTIAIAHCKLIIWYYYCGGIMIVIFIVIFIYILIAQISRSESININTEGILALSSASLLLLLLLLSSPFLFFSFSLLLIAPTISPLVSSTSVLEGGSVTLTCVPSDSRVQLQWFFTSNTLPSGFGIPLPTTNGSGFTYDSSLRHSVTISEATVRGHEGTFICRVVNSISIRSNVSLNVLASKKMI